MAAGRRDWRQFLAVGAEIQELQQRNFVAASVQRLWRTSEKEKKKKKWKQFCILVVVGSVINTCLLAQILRQGLQDVGFAAANSTLQRQSASRFCSRKLTCGAKDSRLQDYGLILGLNKNQKNLVLHKTG